MAGNASLIDDKVFDFIIVGGGTAGLVLANRLSVDPKVSVLVIEAGVDRLKDPKITIPGLATLTYNDPQYDWSFNTVPQVGDLNIPFTQTTLSAEGPFKSHGRLLR